MTDNLILKLFYITKLRRTIINKFEHNLSKYPNICRYLENRYAYFFSYRETLNRTYNNDAAIFVPNENYDAIFTCPPYYNIEEYSCGKFNFIDDYNKLIDNIFNCFYDKESCKILGIVIREDLLPNKFNNYTNKICLSRKSSSHLNKGNKLYKEYLFIYSK